MPNVLRHFTVSRSRAFDRAADYTLRAWIDPAGRAAFETPPGSGLSHVTCHADPDVESEILIAPGGREIGRMFDTIRILRPGHVMVAQGRGVFNGATTMTAQNSIAITPKGTGCVLTGTSQMAVLGEHPSEGEVAAGWDAMLDAFAKYLNQLPSTGKMI
ncbi:hypothetical protein ACK8OR_04095 [Jannaschia sp. KMU-145]|uniref:hypothetical protein n=1 Tax=Jannaschia halovivens TaxID=3388667 RepID=UPI00396B0CCF